MAIVAWTLVNPCSTTRPPSLHLLVPQADTYNNLVRRVVLASGLVTAVAGNIALSTGPPTNYGHADGVGTASSFFYPSGVAVDAGGSFAIIVSGAADEA